MAFVNAINYGMQTLTGVNFESSEQHKETTGSRMEKDDKDTRTILFYLLDRSPFSDDPNLRNIATGETASPGVNVDNARAIGKEILGKMTNATLIGEDTDLLVLLIYHATNTCKNEIYMDCPQRKLSKKNKKLWNIKFLRIALGELVSENILLFHAFLGCDTTSQI